jgi:Rps23 Pro-64 3,4-dihydroxylase Tpa1-like proline 4-hydroxylase
VSSQISGRGSRSRFDLLAELIGRRLESEGGRLRREFAESSGQCGVRYCALDDLLPADIAEEIYRAFPPIGAMRLIDTFRERKHTCKNLDQFAPILADITFAAQAPAVLGAIERITGIREQLPDSSLYAGGLSTMVKGHFLGPHIDNSHDSSGKYYRTLNILYYVTPDWSLECGGNLELWDRKVKRPVTVLSKFNRLVIMETNPWSWHSVNQVKTDRPRCCVSNYYFSERSPIGKAYRNVTSFSARPEQKLLRLVAWGDSKVRQIVRLVAPGGLGKKDVYKGPVR